MKRLIVTDELLTGEITSRKAKRVLFPLCLILFVNFVAFAIHYWSLGASAFPGGRIESGHYYVIEHGHRVDFTPAQYWLSYIHGVSVVVGILAWFAIRTYFRHTGDLKREKPQT